MGNSNTENSRTKLAIIAVILVLAAVFGGFVLNFFNKPDLASQERAAGIDSGKIGENGYSEGIGLAVTPAKLPLSADNEKSIQIEIKTQRMRIFENGKFLDEFIVSTGKKSTPTKKGNFSVISKYPMAYGAGDGQVWGMPFFMGIYKAGGQENGIHELPFIDGYRESSRSLGRMLSHGCVRLGVGPAEKVYNWADIGTEVIIK